MLQPFVSQVPFAKHFVCTTLFILACVFSASASHSFVASDAADNTVPEFLFVPSDGTIACNEVPVFGTPEVEFQCEGGAVSFVDTESGDDCSGSYTRTWTASDGCGLTAVASQTLSYADTESPVFIPSTVPADVTIECSEELPAVVYPNTVDNCSSLVSIDLEEVEVPGTCPAEYTLLRVFTINDGCGNTNSVTQTINVVDTTDPIFIPSTLPADVTIECSEELPMVQYPNAVEECSPPVPVSLYEEVIPGDCDAEYTLNRTFTLTDGCDNTQSYTQVITVVDNTPPSFISSTLPEDMTLSCTDEVPPVQYPNAAEECSPPVPVQVSDETVLGECDGEYSILRTFILSDACGNTASYVQTIQFLDDEGPVFSGLDSEITVECQDVPAPNLLSASNACGEVTVTSNDEDTSADCTESILRTYTAVDACGNSSVFEQVINIIDISAPELSSCPEDASYQCADEVPAAPALSALDNCDGETAVSHFETDLSNPASSVCELSTPGSDADGNLYWAVTLPNWPLDLSPNFIWDENGGQMQISGDELLITGTVVNVEDPSYSFFVHFAGNARANWDEWNSQLTTSPPYISRTYKDQEGNAAAGGNLWTTWDFFEVNASEAKLIGQGSLAGSYLNLSHAPSTYAYGTQVGDAANDKTPGFGMSSWFFVDGIIDCEAYSGQGDISSDADCAEPAELCSYDILRSWISYDDEGNLELCEQVITVEDTQAPEISCPAEITIECTESTEPSNTGSATAVDNCGGEVTIDYVDGPMTGVCPRQFERVWSATDECDNRSECTQLIIITDSEAPEFIASTFPEDISIECGEELPEVQYPSTTDNCDTAVEISLELGEEEGQCPVKYVVTRTFIITDDCDNSTAATQYISIIDTTAPSIEAAADLIIECGMEIPAASAEVSDACGEATYSHSESTEETCGNTYILTRTYTALDECGNSAIDEQVITVVDTTAPEIYANADATVDCDEDFDLAGAEAYDSCGETSVSSDSSFAPTCGEAGIWTITYTASDACGNTATDVQTITVVDNEAPEITVAPGEDIECGQPVPAPAAEVSDNCGSATWSMEETYTAGCGETMSCIRTYTATDECGNTAFAYQTFNLVDNTPPSIVAAADLTLECGQAAPDASAEVSDSCGEATYTVAESTEETCGETYILTRTYTATDDCGNTAIDVQVITFIDSTAPSISAAADELIECNEELPEPSAVASDSCGEATWAVTESTEESCGETYVLTRTYTATDDCGNTATDVQVITVVDTTAPSVVAAADLLLQCGEDIPEPSASASDTCGDATWAVAESTEETCGETYVLTRTYTATDACGNTATDEQVITFVDSTAPSITANPNATVQCGEAFDLAGASAEDTCGDVTIASDSSFAEACGETGVWTITYTATDDCGNTAIATQTITIIDTTPPSITANPNATVECGEAFDLAGASAEDICGAVTIESDSSFAEACGETGVWTITYTATDACDNTAMATQTITIIDNTAPSITAAADQIIECGEELPEPSASASDICGEATWSVTESTEESCGETYVLTRTYTATDACDNTATDVQVITIIDTTPPSIVAAADMTIECGDAIPEPSATASDSCGDATWTVAESTEETCGETYVITRTYTATDDCNNTAIDVQVITIEDTTAPEITVAPGGEIECGQPVPAPAAEVSDSCGEATWTMEEVYTAGCGETMSCIRTYTAMDECNNTAIAYQTFTLVDNTPPSITANADATAECGEDFDLAGATASDSCGEVTIMSDSSFAAACGATGVWTITYTATDECGNSAQAVQTITVLDTTAPEFDTTAEDETYVCGDEIPDAPELSATDSCSGEAEVSYDEEIEGNTYPHLDCELTTVAPSPALNDATIWSMFIDAGEGTEYYVLDENGASFLETNIGGGTLEGHLTGRLVHANDASKSFMIDVYLIEKKDYNGWTSQLTSSNPMVARQAKNFNGVSQPGDELTWDYWLVDASRSQLIGDGDYAGDILSLSHAPTNHLFAFEVGMNANNYSEGYGIGGWFSFAGELAGEAVSGTGDFAFAADCPPCEYTITRTWTATDACGNSAVSMQVITVNAPERNASEQEGPQILAFETEELGFVSAYPNPTGDMATLVYRIAESGPVSIDVMAENGKSLNSIYRGSALSGVDNYAQFDGSQLENGVYIVRIVSNTEVYYQKVLLTK